VVASKSYALEMIRSTSSFLSKLNLGLKFITCNLHCSTLKVERQKRVKTEKFSWGIIYAKNHRFATGKTSRIVKKLKEYLPRIIPRVVLDDLSVHFAFGFDRRSSLSPLVDNLLEAGKKVADQHNKNAVVVFYEFQEIANFDGQENEWFKDSLYILARHIFMHDHWHWFEHFRATVGTGVAGAFEELSFRARQRLCFCWQPLRTDFIFFIILTGYNLFDIMALNTQQPQGSLA
jgi:hypothetical protein